MGEQVFMAYMAKVKVFTKFYVNGGPTRRPIPNNPLEIVNKNLLEHADVDLRPETTKSI